MSDSDAAIAVPAPVERDGEQLEASRDCPGSASPHFHSTRGAPRGASPGATAQKPTHLEAPFSAPASHEEKTSGSDEEEPILRRSSVLARDGLGCRTNCAPDGTRQAGDEPLAELRSRPFSAKQSARSTWTRLEVPHKFDQPHDRRAAKQSGTTCAVSPAQHAAASGLTWKHVGCRPLEGKELVHLELADAIQSKAAFETDELVRITHKEWESLGISYLRMSHFVDVGGACFRPASPKRIPRPPKTRVVDFREDSCMEDERPATTAARGSTAASADCVFGDRGRSSGTGEEKDEWPSQWVVTQQAQLKYRVGGGKDGIYNCVRRILSCNGFEAAERGEADWNIFWGRPLRLVEYSELDQFQKVNHFPGTSVLGRKDHLARACQRARRLWGADEMDFLPKTWILPSDRCELATDVESKEGKQMYIVKPPDGCKGAGIRIYNDPIAQTKPGTVGVVSHYIANPLLISGIKFDIRIYVTVTSFHPLRVYVHEQGLVRLCTSAYTASSKRANRQDKFSHLTNYAVNKSSDKFVANKSVEEDNCGHKWSLRALKDWMHTQGIDAERIMQEVDKLVVKTLVAVEVPINTNLSLYAPNRGTCFELLGFDVLIDSNLKPWLLEVNTSPSLACDSPLDARVKSQVVRDTLQLVRLHQYSRLELDEWVDYDRRQRIHGEKNNRRQLSDNLRRREVCSGIVSPLAELTEEDADIIRESEHEVERRGGFRVVFPRADDLTREVSNLFETKRFLNLLLHHWVNRDNDLSVQDYLNGKHTALKNPDPCFKPSNMPVNSQNRNSDSPSSHLNASCSLATASAKESASRQKEGGNGGMSPMQVARQIRRQSPNPRPSPANSPLPTLRSFNAECRAAQHQLSLKQMEALHGNVGEHDDTAQRQDPSTCLALREQSSSTALAEEGLACTLRSPPKSPAIPASPPTPSPPQISPSPTLGRRVLDRTPSNGAISSASTMSHYSSPDRDRGDGFDAMARPNPPATIFCELLARSAGTMSHTEPTLSMDPRRTVGGSKGCLQTSSGAPVDVGNAENGGAGENDCRPEWVEGIRSRPPCGWSHHQALQRMAQGTGRRDRAGFHHVDGDVSEPARWGGSNVSMDRSLATSVVSITGLPPHSPALAFSNGDSEPEQGRAIDVKSCATRVSRQHWRESEEGASAASPVGRSFSGAAAHVEISRVKNALISGRPRLPARCSLSTIPALGPTDRMSSSAHAPRTQQVAARTTSSESFFPGYSSAAAGAGPGGQPWLFAGDVVKPHTRHALTRIRPSTSSMTFAGRERKVNAKDHTSLFSGATCLLQDLPRPSRIMPSVGARSPEQGLGFGAVGAGVRSGFKVSNHALSYADTGARLAPALGTRSRRGSVVGLDTGVRGR